MTAHPQKVFTEEKILTNLLQIHPTKTLGPNSMLALFFQKFWHVIDRDVIHIVLLVLKSNVEPSFINKKHVILIPKIQNPKNIRDFKLISLCNVIFKITTKIIANRLKHILPNITHRTQSAFVSGRLITDNALITFDTLHWLKQKKNRNSKNHLALKLDISKAYD